MNIEQDIYSNTYKAILEANATDDLRARIISKLIECGYTEERANEIAFKCIN